MNKLPYILFAALFAACSVNESFDVSKDGDIGYMSLSVGIYDGVETTTATRAVSLDYTIDADLVPEVADLKLSIYKRSTDTEGETVLELYKEYESVSAYDTPEMLVGDYTAVVESGDDINEEGAENAFFAGSEDFTIEPLKDAPEVAITATLANSIVGLQVTDDFNNYFPGGATLTLSTEAGEKLEITVPISGEDEVLFVAPDTKIYLEGKAIKQTGVETTFTKSEIGTAEKGMMNIFIVDATETGGATITVTINDTITTVSTTTVDVNSGTTTTEE